MTLNRKTRVMLFILVFPGLALMLSSCTQRHENRPVIYYEQGPREKPRSWATTAKDALILTRIKSKISSDDMVSDTGVSIRVRHGVAILEGRARDIYHRRMILDIVNSTDGVEGVEDHLGLMHQGTIFVTPKPL